MSTSAKEILRFSGKGKLQLHLWLWVNHPRWWIFSWFPTLSLTSNTSVNLLCLSLQPCSMISSAEFYENGISLSKMYNASLCVGVCIMHVNIICSAKLSFLKLVPVSTSTAIAPALFLHNLLSSMSVPSDEETVHRLYLKRVTQYECHLTQGGLVLVDS